MKNISADLNTNNIYQDVNYVISRRLNRKIKDMVNKNTWMPVYFHINRINNAQRFNIKRKIG